MKWRTLSVALTIALALVLSISGASADSGSATLTYIILEEGALFPGSPGAVAIADNGDTIEIAGGGTLTIHPKSVTGGGTFAHTVPGVGTFTGTWTAMELLSYTSYGPADPSFGLPAGSEGGRAVIRVHLVADFAPIEADAILQVDCLLGSPPAGAIEGVRLAIQDLLNFNKEVSGLTLFIRTA